MAEQRPLVLRPEEDEETRKVKQTEALMRRTLDPLSGIDLSKKEKEQVGEQVIREANKEVAELEQKTQGAEILVRNPVAKEQVAKEAVDTLPTHVADNVTSKLTDVDKVTESIGRSQILKSQGQEPGIGDQFMEAISFFLPTIGGAIIGGIGGGTEGALAGAQTAQGLTQQFRDTTLQREELELKKRKANEAKGLDPIELERLNISRQNAETRQKELAIQIERMKGLGEEREARRLERDSDRAIKSKEGFAKQKVIQEERETLRNIDALEDLAEVEVLPGTIGFKIAKGIAGEVGNLTESEREASQISPSLFRRMKRYASTTFKGKIPKEDIAEIKKVSGLIRNKIQGRLVGRANKFSKSRVKNLHPTIGATFRDDILLEIGITPPEQASKEGKRDLSKVPIAELTPEERKLEKERLLKKLGRE